MVGSLVIGLTSAGIGAQELPDLVAQTAPAVVLIKSIGPDGRVFGLGSGFRIFDGRIVTNAHVVEGASKVQVFGADGAFVGSASYATALSTISDLAILPIMGSASDVLVTARSLPRVGQRVFVIGAPEGFANTVSDGIVSAFRSIKGQTLIQITAPISPGSSGGPVINDAGEVIGVSVATLEGGQNLNFAVSVTALFDLIWSRQGQAAFPPATTRSATTRPPVRSGPRAKTDAKSSLVESRWLYLGPVDNRGGRVYLDVTTIARLDENTFSAWTRTTYKPPRKSADGRLSYTLSRVDYDCEKSLWRYREWVDYFVQGDHSSGEALGDWSATVPGTIGEHTQLRVCERAPE